MTEPSHNGDFDEFDDDELFRMLGHGRALVQRIEELIARRAGSSTEEVQQRRRRRMKIVPWAPAVAGPAVIRRVMSTKVKAAVGAVAAVTSAAAALTVIMHLHGDSPRRPHTAPKPSALSAPPPSPSPPPTHSRDRSMAAPPGTSTPPNAPTAPPIPPASTPPAPMPATRHPDMPGGLPAPTSPSALCVAELRGPVTLRLLCRSA